MYIASPWIRDRIVDCRTVTLTLVSFTSSYHLVQRTKKDIIILYLAARTMNDYTLNGWNNLASVLNSGFFLMQFCSFLDSTFSIFSFVGHIYDWWMLFNFLIDIIIDILFILILYYLSVTQIWSAIWSQRNILHSETQTPTSRGQMLCWFLWQ